MSEEFFKSVTNIKAEAHDMLRTLAKVKGAKYAEVVHAVILAEQVSLVGKVFQYASDEVSRGTVTVINQALDGMIGKIMTYYIKSVGFTDAQMAEVMQDAKMVLDNTENLLKTASNMADQGQVLGG